MDLKPLFPMIKWSCFSKSRRLCCAHLDLCSAEHAALGIYLIVFQTMCGCGFRPKSAVKLQAQPGWASTAVTRCVRSSILWPLCIQKPFTVAEFPVNLTVRLYVEDPNTDSRCPRQVALWRPKQGALWPPRRQWETNESSRSHFCFLTLFISDCLVISCFNVWPDFL